MKLSKTTQNFAEKRDISMCLHDSTIYDNFGDVLEEGPIHLLIANDEAMDKYMDAFLIFIANSDGSYTYLDNFWLDDGIKEELPATIRDEKHLREVINFIAGEIS